MTSTVLRVKRRAEDTPREALVLLSKRLKTEPADDEGGSDLALNVFVFSGTLDSQDSISTHVQRLLLKPDKRAHDLPSVKSTSEILKKVRQEHKETSNDSRYEVLNLSRGIKDISENEENEINYALVDVEKRSTDNEKDVQYAYDLYFSQKKDFDVSLLDNVLRVEDLESELIFGSHRDNGRRTPSDRSSESSDDSNDENNWRNEYPDTENSSIAEEDMRKAMEDIDIGNDLSSDADEEEMFNDPTVDLAELNTEDVQRYGLAYAKYKSKVLTGKTSIEDKKSLLYCTEVKDSGDESSDGYKDDKEGFYYGMEEDTDQFISQYRDDSSEEDLPD